jgi:hypothetical protein
MRTTSLCLIVVFAAVVSACSQAENDLAEARERWERHGQGNYQFIWRQSCYCLVEAVQPIYITVQANEIASAVYVSDQQPVSDSVRSDLLTIDGLFDEIEEAIGQDPDHLAVDYDAELGYPRSISIDYRSAISDDEYDYLVKDFAPLVR